jgi:hypothetical protein
MIIVRNETLKKTDYKGKPCYAIDMTCPCRHCYNCHDCTPPNPVHSRKFYSDIFHCATNWNGGCPQPLPEPIHDFNRQKRCKRCGFKELKIS